MKIKDLPENKSLGNVKFIYPVDGKVYYWRSQWEKGVWATETPTSSRLIPLFCDNLTDALEWKVVK